MADKKTYVFTFILQTTDGFKTKIDAYPGAVIAINEDEAYGKLQRLGKKFFPENNQKFYIKIGHELERATIDDVEHATFG